MRRDLTLEHEDRPAGQQRAQMVVGPAIAEAEFQHRSGQIADQVRSGVQAITLGGDAPDETVQPAHEILRSYGVICWYGPKPIAPRIQSSGLAFDPSASRALR